MHQQTTFENVCTKCYTFLVRFQRSGMHFKIDQLFQNIVVQWAKLIKTNCKDTFWDWVWDLMECFVILGSTTDFYFVHSLSVKTPTFKFRSSIVPDLFLL